MNILIDTNIVISLEPTAPEHAEPRTATAASLVRVVSEGGHRLLLHPESLRELAHDIDQRRRDLRDVLLRKYERLDPAPPMADDVVAACGSANPASHDFVDHLMLSAVVANAATFLVTDDGGIHRKAVRLGRSDRVLTVEDALAFLASLLGRTPEPPPHRHPESTSFSPVLMKVVRRPVLKGSEGRNPTSIGSLLPRATCRGVPPTLPDLRRTVGAYPFDALAYRGSTGGGTDMGIC